MHLTYDLSLGSIVTIIVTLAGTLVAAGRVTALLSQTSRWLENLSHSFDKHVDDDARRFEAIGVSLQDVSIKVAAMTATVATLVALKQSGQEKE